MSTELKNVVVIGVGLAAANLVKQLSQSLPSSHRLVAITSTNVAFYAPAALRAAVVPGWEDKPIVELDRLLNSADKRHTIIYNTVTELHDNHVTLQTPDTQFGSRVEFDYAVIATGSNYVFPCRPGKGARSAQDVIQQFKQTQQDVKESSSILVVGAGPVGIEFAGEVAAQYPDKQVTLVSGSDTLLPDFKPSVGNSLSEQLQKLGVKVVYGTKVDVDGLDTGKIDSRSFNLGQAGTVQADYILIATGNKPNTSLVSQYDSAAVNSAGLVKVQPTLQLVSHDNMFAIGDVTDVQETKLAYNSEAHVPVIVSNVLSLIKQSATSKTLKPGAKVIVVTCGPHGGAAQLPVFGLVVGGFLTSQIKSKTLFIPKFRATFNY
ncbi:hypothetical protein OIV83_002266 [Microbotryomycetes sp. JL201]|nr:hypothetical protein OIV83_002266 [Microbotryomycetes sp. JL201]